MARKPLVTLFGIGAPKSGTSWMARCLDQHPEISIPVKETHFFSRDASYELGIPHYESLLAARDPCARIVGEFCPNYLSRTKVCNRLYDYSPAAKLVAILRNPIDRAFSHFLHEVRAGQSSVDEGFTNAWKRRSEYREHGFYGESVGRYRRRFAPEQMLILYYEDVKARPGQAVHDVFSFLEADSTFVPDALDQRVNVSRVPRSRTVERALDLAKRMVSSRRFTAVRQRLAELGVADRLRKLNTADTPTLALTARERAMLHNVYAQDVEELARQVGRRPPWPDFA